MRNQQFHAAVRAHAASKSEALVTHNIDYEKLEQSKAALAQSEREKNAANKAVDKFKMEVKSLSDASNPLLTENTLLKTQLKKKDEDINSKVEQSATAINKLQQTAGQYAKQLKSTQDILKSVQAQRGTQEEQNYTLLKEMKKEYRDKDKDTERPPKK